MHPPGAQVWQRGRHRVAAAILGMALAGSDLHVSKTEISIRACFGARTSFTRSAVVDVLTIPFICLFSIGVPSRCTVTDHRNFGSERLNWRSRSDEDRWSTRSCSSGASI